MMKPLQIIMLLGAGFFLFSCSSSTYTPEFSFGIGRYSFTMSDSLGNKLVDGTLNVKTYADKKISGTYVFNEIYSDKFSGFSSMNGEFDGDVNDIEKRFFINTNPKIADSNVFWNLLLKRTSLSGDWTYSTLRGTTGKGKVKVTK